MTRRVQNDAIIGVTKAVLWEEAKGKLRALAAVEGQTVGAMPHEPEYNAKPKYQKIREAVESFIMQFEDLGLHE